MVSCLLIALCSASHAKNSIVVSIGEYPPYHSKDLPGFGVGSKIVTDIFKSAGVEVTYTFRPWKRALVNAQKGKVDGTALWEYSPEYEKTLYLSDPVFETTYNLFHLKDMVFDWKKIEDLQKFKFGGLIGGYYGEGLEEALKSGKINMDRITAEHLNLKKLLAGRIDILPISVEVAKKILEKEGMMSKMENLTYHPKPLYSVTMHLMLSKKDQENRLLIEKFNEILKQFKSSGAIKQYEEKLY